MTPTAGLASDCVASALQVLTCGHADGLARRQLFFKCEIFQKRCDAPERSVSPSRLSLYEGGLRVSAFVTCHHCV